MLNTKLYKNQFKGQQDNDSWYIASYPRSGNTWCRILIATYLNLFKAKKNKEEISENDEIHLDTGLILSNRSWIDDQLGIDSSDLTKEELDKIRRHIGLNKKIFDDYPTYYKVHDSFYKISNKKNYLVSYKNCTGVIYIIRHPADVAISLSNFFNISYTDSVKFLRKKNASLAGNENKIHKQVYQFLGTWEHHVKSWTEQKKIPLFLLRYEDLHTNPRIFFKLILKFIKLPIDEELISKTIINADFKRLKEIESKYGFFERPDSCNSFFRSGIMGEGKEKLSPKEYRDITLSFKDTLKKFNYM